MKENGHIDKNTFDYLKPDKPKVGRFYLKQEWSPKEGGSWIPLFGVFQM
jgi:hypothetical protein